MVKILFSVLLTIMTLPVLSQVSSPLNQACVIESPLDSYTPSASENVKVTAQKTSVQLDKIAHFKGNVELAHKDTRITADSIAYNSTAQSLSALGNITYQNPNIDITSESLNASLESKHVDLMNTQYWIKNNQVHGKSEQIYGENKLYTLGAAQISPCPDNSKFWSLSSSEINIDLDKQSVSMWHATLHLYDTPVFYIPYSSFPLSSERKSGLLAPQIDTNSLELPLYWNIAPNYDATISPVIHFDNNPLIKAELRHLSEQNNSEILLESINDKNPNYNHRYSFKVSSQRKHDPNVRYAFEYIDSSDPLFFKDFNSNIASHHTSQIIRYAHIAYFNENWSLSLLTQEIKALFQEQQPLQLLPEINVNYQDQSIGGMPLDLNFNSEFTLFHLQENQQSTVNDARLHMEPELTVPLSAPEGFLSFHGKLYYTYYNSDLSGQSTSRAIPEFKIHGGLNFERQGALFEAPYRQTLEPQLQYQFRKYLKQDHIKVYDTAYYSKDPAAIFRDRIYSGVDRISNRNQFTLSVSSAFFNHHFEEQARVTIGQKFYLEKNKVNLLSTNSSETEKKKISLSSLLINVSAQLHKQWFADAALLVSSDLQDIEQISTTLDYRNKDQTSFQINYQYQTNNNLSESVNQVGARSLWEVNNSFALAGTLYFDLIHERFTEQLIGLQYTSCCWGLGVSYGKVLKSKYDTLNNQMAPMGEKENVFYIYITLPSIGSKQSTSSKLLKKSLYNTRKPLYMRF